MWSKAGDMNKERIETGKAPQLLIGACDGDLIIRGGSEPTLHVRGEYTTEETADGYRLSGRGDLRIIVPAAAGVRVDEVSGNLIVKGLAGACEIGRVYGDAILTEAGPARLEAIHGDGSMTSIPPCKPWPNRRPAPRKASTKPGSRTACWCA